MKTAGILLMMASLLLSPQRAVQAAWQAISIWGRDVVPSLFPYMVFLRMLTLRLMSSRRLHPSLIAFLGILGGSPSGAAALCVYAMRTRPSRRVFLALCTVTGTISPMFISVTLAAWLSESMLGPSLLVAHLLSAATSALIVYFVARDRLEPVSAEGIRSADVQDPIAQSVLSVLNVGGCIVFFSVAAVSVGQFLPLPAQVQGVLHAVLEISGGAKAICSAALPLQAKQILLSSLCSFSGLSILSQNALFLRPLGMDMGRLAMLGVLRAVLAVLYTGMLLSF